MRFRPMLRGCSCVTAVTAIVAGLPMKAQAADETLTLTCKGTATIRALFLPFSRAGKYCIPSVSRPSPRHELKGAGGDEEQHRRAVRDFRRRRSALLSGSKGTSAAGRAV